jgi:hypothetical protein
VVGERAAGRRTNSSIFHVDAPIRRVLRSAWTRRARTSRCFPVKFAVLLPEIPQAVRRRRGDRGGDGGPVSLGGRLWRFRGSREASTVASVQTETWFSRSGRRVDMRPYAAIQRPFEQQFRWIVRDGQCVSPQSRIVVLPTVERLFGGTWVYPEHRIELIRRCRLFGVLPKDRWTRGTSLTAF